MTGVHDSSVTEEQKANTHSDHTHQNTDEATNTLEPEIRDALGKILNSSSEGLVEETTAEGAVLLNHQGRFQTAPVATIDSDGKVQIKDYSSLPPEK